MRQRVPPAQPENGSRRPHFIERLGVSEHVADGGGTDAGKFFGIDILPRLKSGEDVNEVCMLPS